MTSRRRFLVRFIGAAALPVLPTLMGCGDDGGDPSDRDAGRDAGSSDSGASDSGGSDADTTRTCATSSVTIAMNHGHTLAVPMSDVVAGVDKTFTTGGSSGHTHSVLVTSADFATLEAGGSVTKTSGNASVGGAHMHSVTVVCLT